MKITITQDELKNIVAMKLKSAGVEIAQPSSIPIHAFPKSVYPSIMFRVRTNEPQEIYADVDITNIGSSSIRDLFLMEPPLVKETK